MTDQPTMRPTDDRDGRRGTSSFGRFVIAMKLLGIRQRLSVPMLTLARIAVGLCDLMVAGSMYLLFVLLQGRSPSHHFWWIPRSTLTSAVVTAALVALRAAMDLISTRAVIRYTQKLYTDLLLRLNHGYNQMRWSRFVLCNRSELSNRVLYTTREAADFYHRGIELAAAVTIVAVMAAALLYQSVIAACCFGVALYAFWGLHRYFIRKRVQGAAFDREESLRLLQRNITDIFSAGKEIRTYGNLAFFQDRLRNQAENLAVSNLRITFLPHVGGGIADQGAVLLFLCIIIVVELQKGDARQVLSLLAFYFVLSRRLIPLISQISLFMGQMEGSFENVKVVSEELNECRLYSELIMSAPPPDPGLAVQFRDVSFCFREDVPILRTTNLSLREGEMMVLRGPSGAGKSSLLNLIAAVTQPTTGTIHVNRAEIAYVPQETPLLDDSIRNNLLFGLLDRSDKELMDALAAANLDSFVTAQPRGLGTGVGDNGALFSGGQRQRLGLARAILRGSRILLLDEATSALDAESERQVLENLTSSGKTIVLVSHRALLPGFVHRVFRLQDGQLNEEFPGDPREDLPENAVEPVNQRVLLGCNVMAP